MFYVAAYGIDHDNGDMIYRFIGWTKDRLAAYKYNVAGKKSLPFYDHYFVFEYPDMPNCDFIKILEEEWDYNIRELDYGSESYIGIYDTPFGDYISLTQQEYQELILEPDMSYNQGRKHMYSAYEYMISCEPFVRDEPMNRFIREVFARYCEIFKGYTNDPLKLSDKLDEIASFISMLKEEELPFY